MSEIRTWFENYVIYQKLTGHEWDILRGIFTNQELRSLEKEQFRRAISNAKTGAIMKGQFCDYLPGEFCQESAGCSGCQIYLDWKKANQEKP